MCQKQVGNSGIPPPPPTLQKKICSIVFEGLPWCTKEMLTHILSPIKWNIHISTSRNYLTSLLMCAFFSQVILFDFLKLGEWVSWVWLNAHCGHSLQAGEVRLIGTTSCQVLPQLPRKTQCTIVIGKNGKHKISWLNTDRWQSYNRVLRKTSILILF